MDEIKINKNEVKQKMKPNMPQKKTGTLTDITLLIKQIRDTTDVFSGEELVSGAGSTGRLYPVEFCCSYCGVLRREINSAFGEVTERKRQEYLKKELSEEDIETLLSYRESARPRCCFEIINFFTIDGLWYTRERNLKARTSLREMMLNSAISAQLLTGFESIDLEYRTKIVPFFDTEIRVEPNRGGYYLDCTPRIAQAYARGN